MWVAVVELIVAVAVMAILVLVGFPLVVGLSPALDLLAARIGVLAHFNSIGRGVIDLRDAVYFLSLAAIFLTLAYGALMARKLAAGQPPVRRLRLGVLLLVGRRARNLTWLLAGTTILSGRSP